MHRSLRIPEIVEHIFIHIQSPPQASPLTDDPVPTFAALARTCTAFLDPALDLLWEFQDIVANFLGCFPGDCLKQWFLVMVREQIMFVFFALCHPQTGSTLYFTLPGSNG
ncbi:hypothetical protein C8R44DRAFT_141689 [Mycena epipterygia]|nr:hypothetical protein C8R44DRAFT_141689 [Mycena epipterygia]